MGEPFSKNSSGNSSSIAENDVLCSEYVRELFQEITSIDNSFSKTNIPKVIVQFWHNLNEIPDDVQECLDSWEPLRKKGFERILFDDARARSFILKQLGDAYVSAFDLCNHPAMRCDYLRLCYIVTYGGFYVDADEIYQGTECDYLFNDFRLKVQPLCYDTATKMMIKPDVFIRKRRYSPNWIFYLNNNPLIAPSNHPIIRLALNRATHIILNCEEKRLDIQSTTGPGNLTASLVRHSISSKLTGMDRDFLILPNWETISISVWPLSYRNDERNWRHWNPSKSVNGKL